MAIKIRKEKNGAHIFDKETGKVKFLGEDIFTAVKDALNCEVIFPKRGIESLPNDCFSAPSKVYLELTRKCTLRCKTCYNSAGEALEKELSKNEIFKVLEDLSQAGTFEIRFTGGEPTSRTDFFEILEYADNLGFFTSIGTNGIWDNEMLERIADSKLKMVIISLEGTKETNDYIRGKGMLDKAIGSIEYLSKNTDKMLRINLTIAKYNKKDIDFIVDLADKYNIPVINTMPIRLSGRSAELLSDQLLSPEEYLEFIRHIEELRKSCKVSIQSYFDILGEKSRWLENQTSLINKKTCAAGVEACVISPVGDVYGCAASNASSQKDEALKKMFIAGNVRETPIMDIWLDSKRWEIYRNFLLNKSKRCLDCEFYSKKCFGNCFISSFFQSGKLNAEDPYCFAHLLNPKSNKNGQQ